MTDRAHEVDDPKALAIINLLNSPCTSSAHPMFNFSTKLTECKEAPSPTPQTSRSQSRLRQASRARVTVTTLMALRDDEAQHEGHCEGTDINTWTAQVSGAAGHGSGSDGQSSLIWEPRQAPTLRVLSRPRDKKSFSACLSAAQQGPCPHAGVLASSQP